MLVGKLLNGKCLTKLLREKILEKKLLLLRFKNSKAE